MIVWKIFICSLSGKVRSLLLAEGAVSTLYLNKWLSESTLIWPKQSHRWLLTIQHLTQLINDFLDAFLPYFFFCLTLISNFPLLVDSTSEDNKKLQCTEGLLGPRLFANLLTYHCNKPEGWLLSRRLPDEQNEASVSCLGLQSRASLQIQVCSHLTPSLQDSTLS